jgi:hypothetical protein
MGNSSSSDTAKEIFDYTPLGMGVNAISDATSSSPSSNTDSGFMLAPAALQSLPPVQTVSTVFSQASGSGSDSGSGSSLFDPKFADQLASQTGAMTGLTSQMGGLTSQVSGLSSQVGTLGQNVGVMNSNLMNLSNQFQNSTNRTFSMLESMNNNIDMGFGKMTSFMGQNFDRTNNLIGLGYENIRTGLTNLNTLQQVGMAQTLNGFDMVGQDLALINAGLGRGVGVITSGIDGVGGSVKELGNSLQTIAIIGGVGLVAIFMIQNKNNKNE